MKEFIRIIILLILAVLLLSTYIGVIAGATFLVLSIFSHKRNIISRIVNQSVNLIFDGQNTGESIYAKKNNKSLKFR